MDFNSLRGIARWEEQIFLYKPDIKSNEQKRNVCNRLRNQLLESKAVVKVQRMNAECESLMISLKQRLMLLQDYFPPKQVNFRKSNRHVKDEGKVKSIYFESSDDEISSSLKVNQRTSTKKYKTYRNVKLGSNEMQQYDSSEESYTQKTLNGKPIGSKFGYKNVCSTSCSETNRLKVHNKNDNATTTCTTTYHSEETVLEDVDTTPTLHIKIPSLQRGNVHYIILDNLNFARQVFDYRANEIKRHQQEILTYQDPNTPKSYKKKTKSINASVQQQLTKHEKRCEFSQLIQDVAEACTEETLQATIALENINKSLNNYEPFANENQITYSKPSLDISISENFNVNDTFCKTNENNKNFQKKCRKNNKRKNEHKSNEPIKKRGRKSKKENDLLSDQLQLHIPTKSNLAKYVELFSNDCEQLPGSSTPATSSTGSQPLVSSTTHNYDVIDQLAQQKEQNSPQQPITYYIDGDWANGGLCQLIATNSESVNNVPIDQDDMRSQFQDYVNCIHNNSGSGNNNERDLESNNCLPISIPLTAANLELQSKNHNQEPSHQILHQSLVQDSLVPIINIQIPALPNNIKSDAPPLAHTQHEVLDLSITSETSVSVSMERFSFSQHSSNNLDTFHLNNSDCLPLDLSTKSDFAKEQISDNNCITIDTQDEDFIRRLIEQNDFNYNSNESQKGGDGENQGNNKSFQSALDMPLLDFDTTELTHFVEQAAATTYKRKENATVNNSLDENFYNECTKNENSNDISMSSVYALSIEKNLCDCDQESGEIFSKLMNIRPEAQFLNDMNNKFPVNNDLNETVFDNCILEHPNVFEVTKLTTNKTQSQSREEEVCSVTLDEHAYKLENILNIETSSSSTSLANSLNGTAADVSLNSTFSDNGKNEFKNEKQSEVINLKWKKILNNSAQSTINDKQQGEVIETITEYQREQNSNVVTSSAAELNCNKRITDNNDKPLSNALTKLNENATENSTSQPSTVVPHIKDINVIDNSVQEQSHKMNNDESSLRNKDSKANFVQSSKQNNLLNLSLHNCELTSVQRKHTENIVFSVAKIDLSEEDNLYATDSDGSSGKSDEIITLKKRNTDVNIKKSLSSSYNAIEKISSDPLLNKQKFIANSVSRANGNENSGSAIENNLEKTINKNSTENICAHELNLNESNEHVGYNMEYLNISYNASERVQNVENNIGQKYADVPKSTESCNEITSMKVEMENILDIENSHITNESLTPLELESKLHDSLDFDEDFDDALSLTTSSFDSPVDERFADSVVNTDTTITTKRSRDMQDDHTIPCPQQINDIKQFKIPKITNTINKMSTGIPNREEINLGNSITTNAVPKAPEILTTSIRNDLSELNTVTQAVLPVNGLEDDTTTLGKITHMVFGINCLPHLVDKCYSNSQCKLSHDLKDPHEVYESLNTMDKLEVNLAYQVLYHHSKLFKVYFEIFCTYYSARNDRLKLLNMVNDCERYPEYAQFIIAIYKSLLKCGLSSGNACRLVLKRIREKNVATSIVEALVAIIMESDWTMFTDFVEKYTQDIYKYNFRICTLEQMAPAVLSSKGPHLKQVFGKCVQTLHCDDTSLLLNSPSLIQCVALLTTNS